MATYRTKNKVDHKTLSEGYKLPIKFNITMLNMFIGYLFKTNSGQITRKSLGVMHKLFKLIDITMYTEPQLEARVEFINRALEAKLDLGFENDDAVLNYCRTDIYNKENEDIITSIPQYTKINYEEVKYINKVIEDRLRYYYVIEYKNTIYNVVEALDTGNYKTYEEINDRVQDICVNFVNRSRSAKTLETQDEFRFSDENFDDNVRDIVTNIQDPKKLLRTGIQKLNEILSPAYMGGRTYIFMGTPGGFKSGILLKCARDIKKYNKGIGGIKPGKRPTILLVTMENSVAETVERLFNMCASDEDIRKFTPNQVVKLLKDSGEFSVSDADDIDIVIKYFANRTITTDDLYTCIDDMTDSGADVITLIFDYIKRIRPAERGKDEKEELKNITNELKSLAQYYDIPVITAHQLNRDAAATIDSAMQMNKTDLGRMLSRSQVGSAWEVMENADWVSILNIERQRTTGQYYLSFKRVKIRYKPLTETTYFNHPFNPTNRMRLVDDIGLDKAISIESLSCDLDGVDLGAVKGKRHAKEREEIEDVSIFDFSGSINKKQ